MILLIIWFWLVHTMGVDYQIPYGHWVWYSFWSGFGGIALVSGSYFSSPFILWRKHNCGVAWCCRIARNDWKDPETHLLHHLCRKHHPDHPGKPIRAAELAHKYHIHFGKKGR